MFSEAIICNRRVFIKRDDLLDLSGLNGNKARKFFALMSSKPSSVILSSIGGVQSNSMLALAKLASAHRDSIFHYFTRPIPPFLKRKPSGVYKLALSMGMKHFELAYDDYRLLASEGVSPTQVAVRRVFESCGVDISVGQWIPQGGAMPSAELGLNLLAEEVVDFINGRCDKLGAKWKVIVESGTGTTAYYLSKSLHSSIQRQNISTSKLDVVVIAVSCVMSPSSLYEYFCNIRECSTPLNALPIVLPTPISLLDRLAGQRRRFAQPVRDHLILWRHLCDCSKIEFDLLYSPIAWEQILSTPGWNESVESERNLYVWDDSNVIYIHCGGTEGTPSQLLRYRHLGLL